jgi:hypothetical protein
MSADKMQEEFLALRSDVTQLMSRVAEQNAELEALRPEVSQLKARVAELEATAGRKGEKYYQNILEKSLGARHVYVPEVGFTDLTTGDAHIEIKKWSDYHIVQGQLNKYNRVIPRPRKCAYFFGVTPSKKRLAFIADLMKEAGIEMYIFDANDVPYRHMVTDEAALGSRGIVEEFIQRRLRSVQDLNALLPWKEVKRAFKDEHGHDPPHDPARTQKPWHYFCHCGLSYVDTCLAACGGKKFRGFRGWKLVPGCEKH